MNEPAAGDPVRPGWEAFKVDRGTGEDAAAVRAELDRILASQHFSRAERPGRFLQFLVEHALEGKEDELDEYTLAVEVFNRKPSFDSTADSIVRVEAGRLRRKLEQYYEIQGSQDPVVIELPQRTYVPVFQRRQRPASGVVWTKSWIPAPASWKAGVLLIAVGVVAGLAAYWIASASGRKSSAERLRAGARDLSSAQLASRSIVVLPFADVSPNHDQEYFCDGLTEELIETLSKVEGLEVVARTTAFHFKGKPEDVREIGRRLNVGLALEGSVRKSGDRLRITAQLINAVDGYHLWSGSYDRRLTDVLNIQAEIARGIVSTALTGFAVHWRRPLDQSPTTVEAYNLYLRGLYLARQWTTDGLTQAAEYLERAIAADPSFAPAYAALAECYAQMGMHGGLPPQDVMPKANAAANRALELDNSLAHAHASLGLVKAVYDWDWKGAEQSFGRAFQLDPTDANMHDAYIMGYLVPKGRLDEALSEIQHARAQDPLSPQIESILGMVYYYRRQNDLAIEQLRKPLEMDPGFAAAHLALAAAYEQKSRFAEAIASVQEGNTAWRSGIGTSLLGHIYAVMGRKDEAQSLLGQLIQLSKNRYISPAFVASIYAGLGDKDRAMEWLEKAYAVRAASLAFLKVNPHYDGLRTDPRFTVLIKKIHLD